MRRGFSKLSLAGARAMIAAADGDLIRYPKGWHSKATGERFRRGVIRPLLNDKTLQAVTPSCRKARLTAAGMQQAHIVRSIVSTLAGHVENRS